MSIKKNHIISFFLSLGVSCVLITHAYSDEDKKPAETSAPVAAAAEKSSYVYDLRALIEKSKNNIQRVNDKIKEQAIYKRNQQREDKAREYYDRAMVLFDEGKVNEARDLFEKSIRITEHPEMKGYIKVSEKKFKSQAKAIRKEEQERVALTVEQERTRQKQVENAYDEGVRLYKQQNFKAARDKFMLVEQLIPEYKGTRSYLKLVEEKLAQQDKVDLVNQKKEIIRQQQQAEESRNREKDMWHKELALKEHERQRKLSDQAKKVYEEAMKFYKDKKFVSAKEKFQEVEWVMPDYKSTRHYLEILEKDIKQSEEVFVKKEKEHRAKSEWDDEVTRKKLESQLKKEFEAKTAEEKQKASQEASIHYQKANELMEGKKYTEARDEFLAVQKIYPDFKATETHLTRLNKELGIIETAPDKVGDQVKEIYTQAVDAYKHKDLGAAKLKFEQVEFMYPDYMATRKYLAKLEKESDAALTEELTKQVSGDNSAVNIPKVGQEVSKEGYEELVNKAEPVYVQANNLYAENKFDESLKEFEKVEVILPNYKATRANIKRVNHQIKKNEQQRYKEEQIQQAETINLLAKQANVLYVKISQLADDRDTSNAQRKFAFIDRLFANMSKEQAKLLAEIADEEEKLRLEEIAYEQEVQRSEFVNTIDPIYQEAVRLYQARKYDEAKTKFLEAQSKISDYRSSKRYLGLIEKQNQLLQQTIKDRESQIAEFQTKASENAELATKLQLKAQESAMIKDLLGQAEAINDEIVALSKDRNFEAIKEKFVQLEKIVDNLLTIKMAAAQREAKQLITEAKSPEKPVKKQKIKVKSNKKDQNQNPKAVNDNVQTKVEEKTSEDKTVKAQIVEEKPKVADTQKKLEIDSDKQAQEETRKKEREAREKEERNKADAKRAEAIKSKAERRRVLREKANQQMKLRQIAKQNQDLFDQAVKSFDEKNYPDAKARFIQLEQNMKYRQSAKKYIEKIDYLLLTQQNQEVVKKEKERAEYIANRSERERMTFRVQEANRDNTRQSNQSTKINSPIVSPTPHYPSTRQEYLSSLNLRSRKPSVIEIADQSQVSQMKDAPQAVTEVKKSEDQPNTDGMSPNEDATWLKRHNQKKLSDRRKKYFEEKQKLEEKRKAVIKKQEDKKIEDERKKAQMAQTRTAARQKAQQQARIVKAKEMKVRLQAQETNAKKLKEATQLSERQRQQEDRLRKLYEQELRKTRSESGFNGALSALETEKIKSQRAQVEREKEVLRMQREEEKGLRAEKERQISNMINRDRMPKLPLRGSSKNLKTNDHLPVARMEDFPQSSKAPEVSSNIEPNEDYHVSISKESLVPQDTAKKAVNSKELTLKKVVADKEAVRKKFENGLAKMYAEALAYYRKHLYKEARDRFTDVEDISPDYKRTRTYLSRIQEEILNEQKRREKLREDRQYNSIQQIDMPRIQKVNSIIPTAPAVNRLDAVSQALDDFESKPDK